MLGSIGSTELLVILVVALLVLGPKSLANVARSVGKVVGEFRRVSTDFQRTLNAEVALEEDKEKRQKAAREVEADLQQPAAGTALADATPNSGDATAAPAAEATSANTPANTPAGLASQQAEASDDDFAPPPGSPLDEALKRTAAEAAAAEAAGATELMHAEATPPAQAAQSQAQQATPTAGRQEQAQA